MQSCFLSNPVQQILKLLFSWYCTRNVAILKGLLCQQWCHYRIYVLYATGVTIGCIYYTHNFNCHCLRLRFKLHSGSLQLCRGLRAGVGPRGGCRQVEGEAAAFSPRVVLADCKEPGQQGPAVSSNLSREFPLC